MRRGGVLAVLGMLLFAAPLAASQTDGGTQDETRWEDRLADAEFHEGSLEDPQDVDTIVLESLHGTVWSVQVLEADAPLNISFWAGNALLSEASLEVGEHLNQSRFEDQGHLEITSDEFTGENAYKLAIRTTVLDGAVNIFEGVGAGFIHAGDSAGDVAVFTVGGGAAMRLTWGGEADLSWVGHRTRTSTGEIESFEMPNASGVLHLRTPDAETRSEQFEYVLRVTAPSTAFWTASHTLLNSGDADCLHDCPSLVDETLFHADARELDAVRWTTTGSLDAHDWGDVYPVKVGLEDWETHRIFATIEGEGVEVQIQGWNESGEFLVPVSAASGTGTIGLNVSTGHHAVKVSGAGNYTLTLHATDLTVEDDIPPRPGEIEDMWREFIPFYIGTAVLLLAPLAFALWTFRGKRMQADVQAHERSRLRRLRARIAELLEAEEVDPHELASALGMLEAVQWRATEVEMGASELTHHTEGLTLKAWRLSGTDLLVGIHVSEGTWELAALRFVANEGAAWKVADVSPASLFDGDEIFLDTLDPGTTRFLRLSLEGSADSLDLHLSGLVGGKPLAAVPARALLMQD